MSDPHKENKRLYALDEAAVGTEEAPRRWQVKKGFYWHNLPHKPLWSPIESIRRDPEAPPLPSLDWHEAPDWANWMAKDLDDIRPAWFECKLSEKGWDLVEQRPNPEWFELTRPDYEASKEDNMDEYLTGAELMYAIGDAMAAGEGPGAFQIKNFLGNFFEPELWDTLIRADLNSELIRRKPRTRHLTDMHGQRWEWPEPMQHRPRHSGPYYVPFINNGAADSLKADWTNHPVDIQRLNRGFCFETDGAAEQHARALIAASGGSCD